MANVKDAVKQARESAAELTREEEQSQDNRQVEGYVDQGGSVQTHSTPMMPSMANVAAASGIIPRSTPYLKVNEFGIRVGKSKKFITDKFPVEIDMTEDKGFMVKMTLRFGNPAQYLSTYDGKICDKGGSWNDALMKARQANPNVDPYPSVDVVLKLTKQLDTGEEKLPAGSLVAFNSSKTNFSEWEDFYKAVADAGLLGTKVKANISCRAIEHNGNEWGVVTFELLDAD